MDREIQIFKKRLADLAERSYQTGIYTYTNFLTMAEQSVYLGSKQEYDYAGGELFGGSEGCERQVLRFGKASLLGYEGGFPICCLEITPAHAKFADKLTHRDYLGTLMHLGIERDVLGDIMIREQTAYLFCMENMSAFILENLYQIKHTNVHIKVLDEMPESMKPQKEPRQVNVSGVRLDAVIAGVYHLPRSQSQKLIRGKKVFLNGRQAESGSSSLKEQDVISVRGYGKFVFDGIGGETRKGRMNIQVSLYV